MDVDAYVNIRTDRVSVRSRIGENRGRVIDKVDVAAILDPEFVVQPGGNKRVQESGVKNVHAFVRGVYTRDPVLVCPSEMTRVTYNPKYNTSFVCSETGREVVGGTVALVTSKGVFTEEVVFASEV
jgi:hypothetical protein